MTEEKIKAAEALYRSVFASHNGLSVLSDILFKLCFMEKIEDEAGIARHNLAIEILAMCGIIKPDESGLHVGNMDELVGKLLSERKDK